MIARTVSTVEEALRRIEAEDASLQAWAFVDPSAGEAPAVAGPLAGMPFGVKDIIDTARMPTAFGLWREHRKARLDAWCVAVLRAAGAVPVGKTRTTAHAYRDPAPTVNPLDHTRTPGGSSAGSAAAVGAGHVVFALGTQTIGSVLRPAAYCGAVGFKPTYGRVPMQGVAPLAPSLDHVGVIARDVALTALVAGALMPDLTRETPSAPRIAMAESLDDQRYAADTRAAVRGALDRLRARGFTLASERLPQSVEDAPAQANLIAAYEAHACLAPLATHALPTELHALLREGERTSRDAYLTAMERRFAAGPAVAEIFSRYDAIVVPCGDAAPSRATTGDGAPFAAWSYFGMPAISIPIPGTAPAAVSLQLVAPLHADARLLAVAALVAEALA